MSKPPICEQILDVWRLHNQINLFLISKIPAKGLDAVPLESRGRTVGEQLAHMNAVRLGWLYYHVTGKRPKSSEIKKVLRTGQQFRKAFRQSGKAVEAFLRQSLMGKGKPRAFRGSPVRWMGYLISHESHHRGSIMLALKQHGMKMKQDTAIKNLWGTWMWGKV